MKRIYIRNLNYIGLIKS